MPSFLQRMRLLRQARARLESGRPEDALALLRAGGMGTSRAGAPLRQVCLDALVALVRERAAEGRPEESRRLLRELAFEDESLARQLAGEGMNPPEPPARRDSQRLLGLLAEMRSHQATTGHPRALPPATPPGEAGVAGAPPRRFLLGVDDAGDFLAVVGSRAVIGHVRSARATIPVLSDVEDEHARIALREGGFHRAPAWILEPAGVARVRINGRELEPGEARALADGDCVWLAPNLAFLVRARSSASASIVLELQEGAESEGAGNVLLFARGPAGRVTLGAHELDHVRVPRMGQHVVLEIGPGDGPRTLCVRSQQGLRRMGGAGAADATRIDLPCPPVERVDIALAPDAADGRPRGFSLRPLDG